MATAGQDACVQGCVVQGAGCSASDVLQESRLPRGLPWGLHMQHFTMVCSTEGCGDKQRCRMLALGMLRPLLSTRASWVSCTGCLPVASVILCSPSLMQPHLMQSQPAFIMVTPKTALEYCSQEAGS